MNYLRSNPATPDGTHFSEFINLGAWDTYLRRMAMDGEWGDWIALWGLINMIQIPVAIVSSLRETDRDSSIPPIVKTKRKPLEIWPYLAMRLSFIIIAWNQWLLRIPR